MDKKKAQRVTLGSVILGKPLIPNVGIRTWYAKELNELTSKMDEKTRREVLKIWKEAEGSGKSLEAQERIAISKLNKYYEKLFKEKGKQLAESMVNRQNRSSASALRDSLSSFSGVSKTSVIAGFKPVKANSFSKAVLTNVKACIHENVNYIKSIQSQYFTKLEGAVYRAIINGQGYGEITQELLACGAETKRRARNIAKDQAHKAYEAISRARMEDAGIKYWQWEHGGGTKTVRHYHILDVNKGGLNHSIHKMGEGAYDPTKGIQRKILPGELPFCSCRMRPVIKFEE